jgi:diacylglycerol kinase
MSDNPLASQRSWVRKFREALRGVREGMRGQFSFVVHFVVAALVVTAGATMGLSLVEWCLLVLCIAGVITAELFNSALESTAKAITRDYNPHLRDSLDIGSAAVLAASIGAASVGAIIFGHRLGVLLGWW